MPRVSCSSLLALHVRRESPAWHAPLTQSSIRSYACTVVPIGTGLASTPQGSYCFTRTGVPTFMPWPAFTQLSLGSTYWSQLAVIAHSTFLCLFVTLPQPLTAEHHNIPLPCRCHEVFFFRITVPFAPAIKIQTLTAMTGLPILTTKLCFERSSGQVI